MWKPQLKYTLFFFFPAFTLILLLYVLTIWTVFMSFTNWKFGVRATSLKFIGLENYLELFKYQRFWESFKNNIIWLVFFVIPTAFLGLILAYLLDIAPVKLESILRPLFLYPTALSFAVTGVLWSWIYDPWDGVLNVVLFRLGFEAIIPWLDDPTLAKFSIISAAVWQYSGFSMIIFLAALRGGLLKSAIEAAKVDGASSAQILLHIILPNIRNAMLVVISLLTIFGLKIFDLVWVMTRGGPGYSTEVLAVYMYVLAFHQDLLAASTAVATIIFALSSLILIPYVHYSIKRWFKHG